MSGTKSDAATIAARRARLLELLSEGRAHDDIVRILEDEDLPASRVTLWRDILSLKMEWQEANAEAFEQLRKKQLEVLLKMEEALLVGSVDPAIVKEWRAIRADISKLLGLNSETDGPAFQLNIGKGGKGPRTAIVNLVVPPKYEPPQRGAPRIDAEPLQLGAGDPEPDPEETQRAEARAELRRKVGLQ